MKTKFLLPVLLPILLFAACKKDSNDAKQKERNGMVLVTDKIPGTGATIKLLTYAKPADQDGVWIDLNDNQQQDEGEKVTKFEISADYPLTTSNTITVYGKVIGLNCSQNEIRALDVSKNTVLTELWCDLNTLSTLDVSKNTALTTLWCQDNNLSSLDVSKNTALTELYCHHNKITDKMDALINSLPARTIAEAGSAYIYIEVDDKNSMPSTAVANAAKSKHWFLYTYNGTKWEVIGGGMSI